MLINKKQDPYSEIEQLKHYQLINKLPNTFADTSYNQYSGILDIKAFKVHPTIREAVVYVNIRQINQSYNPEYAFITQEQSKVKQETYKKVIKHELVNILAEEPTETDMDLCKFLIGLLDCVDEDNFDITNFKSVVYETYRIVYIKIENKKLAITTEVNTVFNIKDDKLPYLVGTKLFDKSIATNLNFNYGYEPNQHFIVSEDNVDKPLIKAYSSVWHKNDKKTLPIDPAVSIPKAIDEYGKFINSEYINIYLNAFDYYYKNLVCEYGYPKVYSFDKDTCLDFNDTLTLNVGMFGFDNTIYTLQFNFPVDI